MLFKPNFCANCGEKIERADWGIFTSRRFCPVCESEFKGLDLIPRAIVALGLLVGVLGLGSYLKTGSAATNSLAVRQPSKLVEQRPVVSPSSQQPIKIDPVLSQLANTQSVAGVTQTPPGRQASSPAIKPKTEAEEAAYYCGAETRKGTYCTRRVKGNSRCFQHKGMPAMLPQDKLRIGQLKGVKIGNRAIV